MIIVNALKIVQEEHNQLQSVSTSANNINRTIVFAEHIVYSFGNLVLIIRKNKAYQKFVESFHSITHLPIVVYAYTTIPIYKD